MQPRSRTSSARFAAITLWAAGSIVCVRLVLELWERLLSPWSGARLAFAAGISRGIDIYPTLNAGVATGDMYGPLFGVFYLPALLLPGITPKLIAGEALSVLALLLPSLALLQRVLPARRGQLLARSSVVVSLIGLLLLLPSTRYALRSIHADAPCLGLGLCSYWVLSGAARPGARRMAGAAALVALATLAKPLAAVVALAEVLLLAWSCGLAVAASYAAACALIGAALGTLLVLGTGTTFEGLWFNMVVVPGSQEIRSGLHWFVRAMGQATLPLFALIALTLVPWLVQRRAFPSIRAYPWPRGALELWCISWALLPISYFARSKVGGDVNSLHCHFYAVVATLLVLADAVARYQSTLTLSIVLAGVGALIFPSASLLADAFVMPVSVAHEGVMAFLQRHPDAYFPWHSLETLAASGSFLQHPDGLHSRAQSRVPMTREQFFAHAPTHPSYIVLPKEGPGLPLEFVYPEFVGSYYPDYVQLSEVSEELRPFNALVFAPAAQKRASMLSP